MKLEEEVSASLGLSRHVEELDDGAVESALEEARKCYAA